MSEDQQQPDNETSRFGQHKLLLMIGGSILVALILTIVSMSLYTWSGAAQVDLSRPGLQSVQKEAKTREKFDGFPASGEINDKVLAEFKTLFDQRAAQVADPEVFGGDVLEDTTLKIDDPALLPGVQ